MSACPTRPALRWFGGKWLLAPKLISLFPPHRIYVEPYGGAASVLLRKPRAYGEVYNERDEEVVSYFRVLRDPEQAAELIRRLKLTPFARAELRDSYERSSAVDPIETARQLVVRSFMGFGSNAAATQHKGANSTGFRSNANRSGTTPSMDWRNLPQALPALTERLRGVVIEGKDAIPIMQQHDGASTLHYVDPPYPHATRSRRNPYCKKHLYRHEMSDADHGAMLDVLLSLKGMVVVSSYASALYDEALASWERTTFETFADGARPRTEVVWSNPAAVAARRDCAMPLFVEAAE
ncbi:DNA adenine methylase [Aurantimonas sp. VKM B-3413]|uniref:DNA adenine methylase n=1 Tax=Aurantimonas sp. VKM B-3413 TaxID=2779401 RepID=UPI001E4890C3|nr:DNA adenine methylase [Aurantimonas sp. VKM B-3413]MCB8835957.1 DNA adenine methylase [Aurantimonas sp. VKM B-3413]